MKIVADTIDGIRYAAVIDGKKLHMVYARPDGDRPWSGDIFAAKILRYAPGQRAYHLDLGNGAAAFMPHKDAKQFSAGATVLARVERPATRDKDVRCSFVEITNDAPGLAARGADVELLAAEDFPDATFDAHETLQDFDTAIVALQSKRVTVANGIELVIEHTEAFTAVDVNNADPDMKPFDANRLAMIELMRQMRLRNLSGQVIVDSLRLQSVDQRVALQDVMAAEAAKDPRKIDLYGFTRLGLFEMTRARHGLCLFDLLRYSAK